MATDPVLTLTQWFSPAYPVGAFAYSHGLERLVETGAVHDADSLEAWLCDVIEHGAGRCDLLFLAAAWRADDPAPVDKMARAFAPSRERLMETDQMGAAFGTVTEAVWGAEVAGLTYPVAVGRAARAEALPLELTARLYAQAFLSNLVGAAQRLMPLGQTEAQRLIRRLSPLAAETARQALAQTLEDLSSTAFLADIGAMQHETQGTRIFRT